MVKRTKLVATQGRKVIYLGDKVRIRIPMTFIVLIPVVVSCFLLLPLQRMSNNDQDMIEMVIPAIVAIEC